MYTFALAIIIFFNLLEFPKCLNILWKPKESWDIIRVLLNVNVVPLKVTKINGIISSSGWRRTVGLAFYIT